MKWDVYSIWFYVGSFTPVQFTFSSVIVQFGEPESDGRN